MKSLRALALCAVSVCLFACGTETVQYNLACLATCTGGEVVAVAVTACETPGQDVQMVAQQSADKCVSSAAEQMCPNAACVCEAQETATICN